MANLILTLSLIASCQSGTLTEHRAFDQVFSNFPARIDNSVYGYVATSDCDDIGRYGLLIVGNNIKSVVVADCLNQNDKQKDPSRYKGWVSDVDEYLYSAMEIRASRNYGTLCLFSVINR